MITAVVLVAFLAATATASNYVRVCYYTNWAQYRPEPMKFFPEDIDPFLCTHIMYSFAKITNYNKLDMYEWNDDKMYPRVMALKQKNPNLKIFLAVGGWNHENGDTSKFSVMVNSQTNRQAFIKSTVELIRHWGFDGFDLDWEYPAGRGNSPPGDKQMFTLLCKELIQAFDKDAVTRQKPRLQLSAAVSASHLGIDAGYEAKELGKYLDILNLMAYDLHGIWDKVTGHHAAMAGDGVNAPNRKEFTIPYAVDHWIKRGFPAKKIALGMGTYGRAFFLKNPSDNGLGAPIEDRDWNKAPKGEFTREEGFLAYYEICKMGLTVVHNSVVDAPYGYKDKTWVGYDDQASLKKKVESQIIKKGLAGAMFWCLDLDDFNGRHCGQGRYPLMSSVAKLLGGYVPPVEPTFSPTTKGPSTPSKSSTATDRPATNPPSGACKAIDARVKDQWCNDNCPKGYCPTEFCKC
ncbi:chitinase-3-like protein 1 isoform X2 [Hydra vulgaris]|uniref:Chitinase-3-like protein 1 isoform X2 n=1 Tax=Hydra vulgaris TaxID=6087 RepID=A0ABM4CF19_HYDVU